MKWAALILILVIGYSVFSHFKKSKDISTKKEQLARVSPTLANKRVAPDRHSALFVPYWNTNIATDESKLYDRFFYFGVAVDTNGIIEDEGYAQLDAFIEAVQGKESYLTVRMLDTATNLAILEDGDSQEKIADSIILLAKEKGFSGIVLDLEISALSFGKLEGQIDTFVSLLADKAHTADIKIAMTLYGDTFYRGRPYRVRSLAQNVDEILVMAYDFHKSRGEPGPNFPLNGRMKYGYDFTTMISEFQKSVESTKLTVIFGMYGYDWTLGAQGKPLKAARSRSLNDIRAMVGKKCVLANCISTRDGESSEMKITYTDAEKYERVMWHEDEKSVSEKMKLLEKKGIGSVGYWVNGYF